MPCDHHTSGDRWSVAVTERNIGRDGSPAGPRGHPGEGPPPRGRRDHSAFAVVVCAVLSDTRRTDLAGAGAAMAAHTVTRIPIAPCSAQHSRRERISCSRLLRCPRSTTTRERWWPRRERRGVAPRPPPLRRSVSNSDLPCPAAVSPPGPRWRKPCRTQIPRRRPGRIGHLPTCRGAGPGTLPAVLRRSRRHVRTPCK